MIYVWYRYKASFGRYDAYEIVHLRSSNYRIMGGKLDPVTGVVSWEVVTEKMTLKMARLFVANHIEWKDNKPVVFSTKRG